MGGLLAVLEGVEMMRSIMSFLSMFAPSLLFTIMVPITDLVASEAQIWHIKAVHPAGKLLDVKAIDKDGGIHDVKAIQQTGNRHILDIKAFVDGKVLPVKVLASGSWLGPVKAIGEDGAIFDIKALTANKEKLDVKAVSRSGHVLDIKAVGDEHQFYGVKAVSAEGQLYDVKGVKMSESPVEVKINNVEVRAHVKALPQVR